MTITDLIIEVYNLEETCRGGRYNSIEGVEGTLERHGAAMAATYLEQAKIHLETVRESMTARSLSGEGSA